MSTRHPFPTQRPGLASLPSLRLRLGLAWLLGASALYLWANAVARWMRWTLFHGHGAYGWAAPGPGDYVLLVVSTGVPFLLSAGLLFLLLSRWAVTRGRLLAVALLLFGLTLLLELDMAWFQLSRRHIGLAEAQIFAEEDWRRHLGLREADLGRFLRIAALHAGFFAVAGLGSLFVLGRPVARAANPLPRQTWLLLVLALVALGAADLWLTGRRVAANQRQWATLLQQHPLRIAALDGLARRYVGVGSDLAFLNAALAALPAPAPSPGVNPLAAAVAYQTTDRPDVVVLAIEGLNLVMAQELPTMKRLRAQALVGARHYATGDATHYGLLGLTHGLPMLFYGREPRLQSRYIEAFNRAGYATRRFGTDVTSFGQIGSYVQNFSHPVVEPPDDWTMLVSVKDYLGTGAVPKFALVYYYGTHWPYAHGQAFRRHQPEVPEDFDYGRWDLADHRSAIVNRYRNALDEMDAWLERFVQQLDLRRTLLVVTADHGEEMFEGGRLSHAGGVWEEQLRVPLLMLLPGQPPGEVAAVSSHAHVLPAIARWLRLDLPANEGVIQGPVALAGHNNHTNPPLEWALVTAERKLHFTLRGSGQAEITAATDPQDRPLPAGDLGRDPALRSALGTLRGVLAEWQRGAVPVGAAAPASTAAAR